MTGTSVSPSFRAARRRAGGHGDDAVLGVDEDRIIEPELGIQDAGADLCVILRLGVRPRILGPRSQPLIISQISRCFATACRVTSAPWSFPAPFFKNARYTRYASSLFAPCYALQRSWPVFPDLYSFFLSL